MEKVFNFIKKETEKYNIKCIVFDPSILKKDKQVEKWCKEDKCNNYKKNYMCPPLFILPDISDFYWGIILQYECPKNRWKESKIKFHKIILHIENLISKKFPQIQYYSFIGGSCELCTPCKAVVGEKCKFPNKARPSLESAGFNVLKLLKELNLPNKFFSKKVIWTGAILLK